jgi:tRNA (cmo5U34)-methyltransferase
VRVCDLGCGDGALAAELLAVDDTLDVTLMDASEKMLEAARQRFGPRTNIRHVHAAFDAMLRSEVQMGPFDFIVSSFAIHHLHLAEKAVLFQRLFEELQPGGWFLNIDSVLPDHSVFSDWLTELWRDQIIELEKVHRPPVSYRDTPERALNDPDNKFSTLAAQLKALKAAGFIEVECHYRNGRFAVYTGRKP